MSSTWTSGGDAGAMVLLVVFGGLGGRIILVVLLAPILLINGVGGTARLIIGNWVSFWLVFFGMVSCFGFMWRTVFDGGVLIHSVVFGGLIHWKKGAIFS